jgi:membrane protease subunit (stomatin/prohibitin family)
MALLKIITMKEFLPDEIIKRVDCSNDYVTNKSKLLVRESQAAIFCHQGKLADVFLPGEYALDTSNIPLLTKLMSWKYGFESPFKSDIYYVSTKQFIDQKWGTSNPIMVNDREFGLQRIRAYGTYAFRIADPYVFLTEIASTGQSFRTPDITNHLRSKLVTEVTDIIGELRISIIEMSANVKEVGLKVKTQLQAHLKTLGITLTDFNFENFSLPDEVQQAIDKNAAATFRRGSLDVEERLARADAMRDAAKNPGIAGAGMGLGLGLGFGQQMTQAVNQTPQPATATGGATIACPKCHASIPAKAKFCPECGQKIESKSFCPNCGKPVPAGTKFCPECGRKIS